MKKLLFSVLLFANGVFAQTADTTASVDSVRRAPLASSEAPLLQSQSVRSAEAPRREFLPKSHLFDPIVLDPLEAQTYVSVLPVYQTEGKRYNGSIVPFGFGLRKPFFRWNRPNGRQTELAMDVASFTQFEVFKGMYQGRERQRRQLINTDYRVGFWYNIRARHHAWRIRGYHLSSHLGDDYTIRNSITSYLPNPVNYEQLDVTYSHERNGFRKYLGVGAVLRKPEERKRLAGQAGVYYRNLRGRRGRFVAGADLKVWEQTAFRPGIHAGMGYEAGTPERHLTFLVETYSGFRPYSLYEHQQTAWFGFGMYFNPI